MYPGPFPCELASSVFPARHLPTPTPTPTPMPRDTAWWKGPFILVLALRHLWAQERNRWERWGLLGGDSCFQPRAVPMLYWDKSQLL